MSKKIHSTAVISIDAKIADNVEIGPYCVIDDNVIIESGVKLESQVRVYSYTKISRGSHIYDGAILGGAPQDLKYAGEKTWLYIGENCTIREYCTLNRGTKVLGYTSIGDNCLLMAYSHLGHDCILEDNVILANGVQVGGHVEIAKHALIGGNTAIQQFSRIGAYCYVGGTLKIDRDIPPASKAFGNPLKWAGLNVIGLKRHNFLDQRIKLLKDNYKHLYRSGTFSQSKMDLLSGKVQCDSLLFDFLSKERVNSQLISIK